LCDPLPFLQLCGLWQTDCTFCASLVGLVVDYFKFPACDFPTGFERFGSKRDPGFGIQFLLRLVNNPRFQVTYFDELPLFDVQPLADLVYFQASGSDLRAVPGAAHLIKCN
jgi:hypothetical protein